MDETTFAHLEKAQSVLALVVLVLALIFGGKGYGVVGWWLFAVILGLVVPLASGFIRKKGALALASPVVAFLVVLGAFFMRYAILMAGQAS